MKDAQIAREWQEERERRAARARDHKIYFAEAAVGLDLIKIGFAADVPQRMEALRTGCPAPLRLLGTMPGSQDVERFIHETLAAHRVHGEWFRRCPEVEALVEKLDKPYVPSPATQLRIDRERRYKAYRARRANAQAAL